MHHVTEVCSSTISALLLLVFALIDIFSRAVCVCWLYSIRTKFFYGNYASSHIWYSFQYPISTSLLHSFAMGFHSKKMDHHTNCSTMLEIQFSFVISIHKAYKFACNGCESTTPLYITFLSNYTGKYMYIYRWRWMVSFLKYFY